LRRPPPVETAMIDRQALIEFALKFNERGDITIKTCREASGVVKALVYSGIDHCFHITVDGRERMCSDIPDTVCRFFNGLASG